jgi:transposase
MTVAQLAARHGVHQTMINAWKKQAVEGMAGVFSAKVEAVETARESEIDQLHAKIGQLVVERDFLRRASGR